eukprot:7227943-Heterocapsa_arctica.AAC.1
MRGAPGRPQAEEVGLGHLGGGSTPAQQPRYGFWSGANCWQSRTLCGGQGVGKNVIGRAPDN